MATFWKPVGSLDLSTDPASLPVTVDKNGNESSGAMQRCKNLKLDENGVAVTRDGSSVLDSGLDSLIYEILEQGGSRYAFAGDEIYKDGVSIASGLSQIQWSGVLYNAFNSLLESIYALNGTDRKRIDGSDVNEWGMDPPSVAPVITVGSSAIAAPTIAPVIIIGALTGLTGDYNARYTYVKKTGSVVTYESAPSPVGVAAVTLADQSLDITWTASGDPQVTHVRIYRTEAGGSAYFYDQEVAVGIVTIDSNTEDSALTQNGLIGDYNTKYTYLRKESLVIVSESDPSPAAVAAVALENEPLGIVWVASTDPQVTHVRIYRTLSDGLIYYFDQDVAIGTLTVDSNTGDLSLGSEVETDHDRPPLGTFVIGPNYNGTCFIIKDNLVYYCSPKQPEYWPVGNFIEVSQKQFPGKCAVFWNGQLYYFNKIDIYLIQGTGSTSFFPARMSGATGSQSNRGAVAVDGRGIYHIGPDGIYLFSNQKDTKLTQEILEKLFTGQAVNDVPGVDKTKLGNSWIDHFRGKIYFGYCGSADTYPTNVIVFDYTSAKVMYYKYPFQIMVLGIDRTNEKLLAGDNAGNVYHIENPDTDDDNSTEIDWEVETKDFTRQTRKHFPRYAKYDVDASGVAGTTKGSIYLDKVVLQDHTLSGNRQTRRRLITTGNGDKVSVRIIGSGPVAIYALEFE